MVLRTGSYHESISITANTVTIQNYPGEAVWFDGSSSISGFVKSGSSWVLGGWTAKFDSSPTYTAGAPDTGAAGGFVNYTLAPMAAHPDQVWINDVAQRQVSAAGQVVPGSFYVDYATSRLYLGSDPTGRTVRASDLGKAITIRTANSRLLGVGIRRYADSIPTMGAVTAERPGIKIENAVFSDMATTGLSLDSTGIIANRITAVRNGLLGIHGVYADNLRLSNIYASGNNTEQFNQAPVSGGAKITRTRGIAVDHSSFDGNNGPGLWLDESTYNSTIIASTFRNNKGHGMSLEISAKTVVADNLIANNGGNGIKLNDTSDATIWNNTFMGNNRPLNIVEDARRASDRSVPGHDPRQAFPDPTMSWIIGPATVRNNVFAGTAGNCELCVEDYSHQYSAEQFRVTALGDVYQRDSAGSPSWLVVWSTGGGNPKVFNTLSAFHQATQQEAQGLELTGVEAVTGAGKLTAAVTSTQAGFSQSLPAAVASLVGQPAGTRKAGAFL